ncbi:MAG TPA: hypothetical protein VF472_07105 [Burkholderiaceae bacterium]
MIDYFEVADMPGKYFICKRYGTMSPEACARNYRSAPDAIRSGRLEACLGCAIGHGHAGGREHVVAAPAAGAVTRSKPACLRCRRSGRESASRLIGRMRLIRQHTICVSCYNREREVLRGRNAKGAPPRKWAGLYFTHISYVKAGQPRRCERLAVPVLDRIEAALLMLRRDGVQSVYFAAREPVRSACAA